MNRDFMPVARLVAGLAICGCTGHPTEPPTPGPPIDAGSEPAAVAVWMPDSCPEQGQCWEPSSPESRSNLEQFCSQRGARWAPSPCALYATGGTVGICRDEARGIVRYLYYPEHTGPECEGSEVALPGPVSAATIDVCTELCAGGQPIGPLCFLQGEQPDPMATCRWKCVKEASMISDPACLRCTTAQVRWSGGFCTDRHCECSEPFFGNVLDADCGCTCGNTFGCRD